MRLRILSVCVLMLFISGVARAEGGPFDYRVAFWGGAFFADADTTLRWDTSLIPGTEIGLESTLGTDDNKTAFNGEFQWRFFNRHALGLRIFDLKRDGDSNTPINLVIDGETIPIDTEVATSFETQVIAFKYDFAFVKRDNLMMEVGLGLSVQDLDFKISADDVGFEDSSDLTAPLPTITLGLDWAITPKWIASADFGWFDLQIDDVKGEITEFRGGITWKPWDNFGFNLAYDYFKVKGTVKKEKDNFQGVLKYKFKGPLFGIVATF